jgi:membrane protease YdiL (CAAX protease family)
MSFFWMAVLVEGGLAVIAILADTLLFGFNHWQYIQYDSNTLWQIIGGLLPLIAGYFVLQALPFAPLQRVDQLVRELFLQHMNHLQLWQLAVIAILAGIGEELFFRGLLQLGCSAILPVWIAILVVSLVFALAHAATQTYFWLTFFVAIYFSCLFLLTGNLVVPIAIHALYDFAVFLYIRCTPHKQPQNLVKNDINSPQITPHVVESEHELPISSQEE